MITDEERRRVAKRMYDAANGTVWKGNSFCAMLARMTRAKEATRRAVIHKLADLIDRPTTTRHGKFKTKYGRETPLCEVCGYSIGDMRWNYCPKCGAVITDD